MGLLLNGGIAGRWLNSLRPTGCLVLMNEKNPADARRWHRHSSSYAEYFIGAPAAGDAAANDEPEPQLPSPQCDCGLLVHLLSKLRGMNGNGKLLWVAKYQNILTVFLSLKPN